MKNERLYNEILEAIKDMTDSDIVCLWNEYARKTNSFDDEILTDYELEELIENSSEGALYWINKFFYGHADYNENEPANPNHSYFYFNGYGNIISMNYITNSYAASYFQGPIDIDSLINYIIDNEEPFYNSEIEAILEG